MGGTSPSTSLMPQLLQAVIPPQRDASVGLKRFVKPFEDYLRFTNKLTHSTCGASKLLYYRMKVSESLFKIKL